MMIDFLYIFLVMIEKVISGRLGNFKWKNWNYVRKKVGCSYFGNGFN